MLFLITLVIVVVFVLALSKAIRKLPILFYIVALILVGSYIHMFYFGSINDFWRTVLPAFQRCTIALAFFTVVMFTGLLPQNSFVRKLLMPIRGQLSILGTIFSTSHVAIFSITILPKFYEGILIYKLEFTLSVILALVITLLLIPLTVTSFNVVIRRMDPHTWKRIQLLAYPFFALIYVHIVFAMMPHLLSGNTSAIANFVAYTAMFCSYAVLRIRKRLMLAGATKQNQSSSLVC